MRRGMLFCFGIIQLWTVVTIWTGNAISIHQPFGPQMCVRLSESICGTSSSMFVKENLTCLTENNKEAPKATGTLLSMRHCNTSSLNSRRILSRSKGYKEVIQGKRIGALIGSRCTTDVDCTQINSVCYRGICLCTPGYSYIPNEGKCNRTCAKYGTTTTPYKGLHINGHYRKMIFVVRDGPCLTACINETSFMCLSADIVRTRVMRCYLSDYGYMDVSPRYRGTGNEGFTLNVRNCAP